MIILKRKKSVVIATMSTFTIALILILTLNKKRDVSMPISDITHDVMEELDEIPKYDRPDLAMSQNLEMIRDPSTKDVPISRTMQTLEKIKSDAIRAKAIDNVNWTERGPNNVGGRTRALMYDPNDASGSKVWAGGVGGGLWFNDDITSSTSTWQNIDDFWANLAISAIAYDPTNTQTFYIGTGEGYFNIDAQRGAGIWKSTNGGTSWSQLSATDNSDFHYVQKVAVTPNGTILVATREGLFRSTNDGSSFSELFSGKYADIEVASNGDIYASEGIFSNGSVIKSTDDGVSWSTITPTTGGQRIELAVSPSDPDVVYAVASNLIDIAWFQKSTDGGESWSPISIPVYSDQFFCFLGFQDFARGQAWFNLIIKVHPTNPDIAIVGGIDLHRTTDGGINWNAISNWTGKCGPYVHADQHAILFSPVDDNTAIFGNDGGVFYSSNLEDASGPEFSARNNGYNVTQFYGADQVNTNGGNFMLAGAQDNGSHKFTSSGMNSTTQVTGGDGVSCHIDQSNSNYQITSHTYNHYFRSTDGGASFVRILNYTAGGRFINPTDYDDDAKVLYGAADQDEYLFINDMTGTTVAPFSVNTLDLNGSMISAIKVSPYTDNRIFVCTAVDEKEGSSSVFVIDNANSSSATVTEIGTSSLPSDGYISSIDVGTSDSQLIITYSNYGTTSVWETRNDGSSWSNREGNLPDIPVRWVLYNPNNTDEVLLATELGVWSTDDVNTASPDWGITNTGLANVRCNTLRYRESDGMVIVATHGRGVYTATPFDSVSVGSNPMSLTTTNVTESGFDISWAYGTDDDTDDDTDNDTDVTEVTGYDVYLNGSLEESTTSTSYSFSKLSDSTRYDVTVEAIDAAGNILAQTSISATTTAEIDNSCTASVLSFPYIESFEIGEGDWTQNTDDDLDWTLDANGTTSPGTGPSTGADGSFYLYIEASDSGTGYPDKNAIITSPCMDVSDLNSPAFNFSYHMNGTAMGDLIVQTSIDGLIWNDEWSISGSQGDVWNDVSINLPSDIGVQIRFSGTTSTSFSSDIAIDDISVTDGVVNSTAIIPIKGKEAEFEVTPYPNPVSDVLNITHNFKSGSYSVISLKGRVVMQNSIDDNLNQINMRKLKSGVYMLKMNSDKGKVVHKFRKK